ncbi:MAG: sulfatase-like hydrolase/transferase [Planctomycetaceae bacterium]|jgi:hypothetical protein|nr:sulfatase-like hydrolase/transferase [Planctomycetaceae bacterium]
MNLFILSIDGLQNAMLGTYGNAWIQTPALNKLAAQSVVFDRYYTNSLDIWDVFETLWQNFVPSSLITDDSDVFLHPNAADIEKKQLLNTPDIVEPVAELEETQFFKAAAAAVDMLRNGGVPQYLNVHLQGFRGIWDFPLDYRKIHQDDEDPEPYHKLRTDSGERKIEDKDELQAVIEAYSGGVAVLDDVIAGVLNLLENGGPGKTMFVLMGTRGFSLGEHGVIGANDALYSENLHLPLLIRFPNQEYASVRVPQMLQPADLAEFLRTYPNDSPLLRSIKGENETEIHELLEFQNGNGERAVLTPEWFLRNRELYVKPDDKFEFNNVADRQQDVIEKLVIF